MEPRLEIYQKMPKDELEKLAKEYQDAFDNELTELYQEAAFGRITDYDVMIDKVFDAGRKYAPYLYDMGQIFMEEDLYRDFIEALENARNIRALQEHARSWLDILNVVKQVRRPHWENEKGEICDENGHPLSLDGRHRVFEVIKGGKYDKWKNKH